jgi:hypothetical protein
MASMQVTLARTRFGQTSRPDVWWVQPAVVFVVLASFLAYATWAAFQGDHYTFGPYLSPFYSPELFGDSPHSLIGSRPPWWPAGLPFSPALLILGFPAGFRLTCYYYRGAYYKAFWADPPACTVGEPRKLYRGERSFPLVLQNVHRFFLYVAVAFLIFLAHDVWKAMWFTGSGGQAKFGIGVGTVVLAANVVLLGGYTLGCHSLRHLIGGFSDQLSKVPLRRSAYNCASCFNRRHMTWAWCSLVSVAFSDLYIRMCSMGIWSDWRIL